MVRTVQGPLPQSFTLPRDGAHFIGDVPKIKGDGMPVPVRLFSQDPPETRASLLPAGRSVTVWLLCHQPAHQRGRP